jgi:hypothetical protein
MKLILIALAILIVLTGAQAQENPTDRKFLSKQNWESKLHQGDMVFIRSRSQNAEGIAMLSDPTAEPDEDRIFTHCGIVLREDGQLKVLEGAGRGTPPLTLENCQTEEAIDVAHEHGDNPHHIYVRRWRSAEDLAEAKLASLIEKAKKLHSKPYDHAFSWTDDKMYCSELIWKAYAAASLSLPHSTVDSYMKSVQKVLDDPNLDDGKRTKLSAALKRLALNRGGPAVDPDEYAVSPEDIFNSKDLVSITDDSP